MIRQTWIERHRLIKLAVESMDAASPEKELADFYMEGESEDYIREERGWTRKRIWQTKRKIRQILIDAGIVPPERYQEQHTEKQE